LKKNWDISIFLQPDELLSSWLIRTGLANGCDPLMVSEAIWGNWRAWTNDIDRYPGKERMTELSLFSGENIDDLYKSILLQMASDILGRNPTANELWPWLLTTGTRNRIRRGGLQYCSDCLNEDKKPYYRREWRLAWHVCCVQHGKALLDSCPHCQAPIEPHRLIATDKLITQCASCHQSLLDVTAPLLSKRDIQSFQVSSDNILFKQIDPLVHGKPTTISEWFDVVRYYESFVRRCILTPHPALKSFAELLLLNFDDFNEVVSKTAFEQLNVVARSTVLREINKVMLLSQDELLVALTDSGVSRQGFSTAKKIQLPKTLMSISLLLADKQRAKKRPVTRKKNTETAFPKPKPKWEVDRMWNQVLKKISNNPLNG